MIWTDIVIPLLAAFGGIVLGGIITHRSQIALQEKLLERKGRAFAHGFAAELEAYLKILEVRKAIDSYEAIAQRLEAGQDQPLHLFVDDPTESPLAMLPFADKNFGDIAFLPAGPREDCVNWLTLYRGVRASVIGAAQGKFSHLPVIEKAKLVRGELDLFKDLLDQAGHLISRLRAV